MWFLWCLGWIAVVLEFAFASLAVGKCSNCLIIVTASNKAGFEFVLCRHVQHGSSSHYYVLIGMI